jgi:alanine dehydrogenase
MAGYCSVFHALERIGSTGTYGRRLRAAVIGFGATARGAVTALNAVGVHDIDILTNRNVAEVASPIHSAEIVQFETEDDGSSFALTDDGRVPIAGYLAEHDVVVNCVLQDPKAPLIFVAEDDLDSFRTGSLFIDVSCDAGMGFSWALPTSFEDPTFVVGNNMTYYAVDHSPSYLWNAATWEISEALIPYLTTILGGPAEWDDDDTVTRAIEIRDGEIKNPDILAFQHRAEEYPHVRHETQ